MSLITRIKGTMSGSYCLKDTRIPVWMVKEAIGFGLDAKDMWKLTDEQVEACKNFRK